MTRFEKDLAIAAEAGEAYERMMGKREVQIAELRTRMRTTKNGFIAKCAKQDLDRELAEYRKLALAAGDEVR